jgi:type IV secretion system protein VirB4
VISVNARKDALKDLDTASSNLVAILADFGVKALKEKAGLESPLAFFARIINPISRPAPRSDQMAYDTVSELLVTDEIFFSNKGFIRFSSGGREKYMAVVGIKQQAGTVDEQMLSDILSLNFELTVLHNMFPFSKLWAQLTLINQKRMASSTTLSYDVLRQFDDALALIEQGDEDHQTLVNYAETFFVSGESQEALDRAVFEIEKTCRLYGVVPVREGWVAEASWFAQFPTYDKYPRMYKMLSRAVATSFNFERQPEGLSKCDWGNSPVAIFPTYQGTAYQFEFHVSSDAAAVAHTVAIGPTGQGKTTLYSFLAGMSLKFDGLKTFFFDRHRGAEIFTYASDGSYINFEGDTKDKDALKGGRTAFLNPFRIEDNPENRGFLRRWLKEITLVDDASSEAEIARAVTTAFDYLEPAKRTLKNLYKSCFAPAGRMRRELYRWVDDNQYGMLFNSESDTLDLSSRFSAFDFTYVFEDETLAPAVVSYIMNRIQNITGRTGTPSLIIIDETAPMLANPMFRQNFVTGLQEGRKKRQAYLAAFQQPNVVDKLGIGEVIRGQCQTEIFFRNVQARAEDYENWNLTPKEMAFIQGKIYKDMKYAILFKKPTIDESVILNVDLSGLGPYLQLFNSGRKSVLLAEELRKLHGNKFVEVYLDSFK